MYNIMFLCTFHVYFAIASAEIETGPDINELNEIFLGVNMSKCECADILASVFPQLVMHWNAAGNKLKTFR